MAKKNAANAAPKNREEALEDALDTIRGKFGAGSIMRLGEGVQAPVEVIPSGILPLDVALGVGGYPRGRVVEIFGPEGSGKTTVALCAIAEVQKAKGIAAFIDVEHALDPRLAATIGVDLKELYLSQPDSAEQALFILDELVKSSAVDLVVVDSVAALTPNAEIEGTIGESQVGLQARLMSYALRRLTSVIARTKCVVMFINQLRAFIGSGYGTGPTETTAGGRALKFYASVRLEVRRMKRVEKSGVVIGHELSLKVVKNKLAPPFRSAHTTLIYGKGIPMGVAVVDMAVDYKVFKKKGGWIAYKGETLGQGKDATAKLLTENPELQAEVIKEIMAKVSEDLGFTPVEADDSDDGAEDAIVPESGGEPEVEEAILDLSDDG